MAAAELEDFQIFVNFCDLETLQMVDGLTDDLAVKIIAERKRRGNITPSLLIEQFHVSQEVIEQLDFTPNDNPNRKTYPVPADGTNKDKGAQKISKKQLQKEFDQLKKQFERLTVVLAETERRNKELEARITAEEQSKGMGSTPEQGRGCQVTEILEDEAEFRIPENYVKAVNESINEVNEYRKMTKDLVAHLVAERGRLMEENRKMAQALQEIKRAPRRREEARKQECQQKIDKMTKTLKVKPRGQGDRLRQPDGKSAEKTGRRSAGLPSRGKNKHQLQEQENWVDSFFDSSEDEGQEYVCSADWDDSDEDEQQNRGRQGKVRVGPKNLKFDGSRGQDWSAFKKDFKLWAQLHNITSFQRLMFAMSQALEGRARQYFNCLRNSVASFPHMLRELTHKFGKTREERAEAAMVELQGTLQGEDEDLDSFEDRVTLLAYQAFPDGPDHTRVRHTIIAFINGLQDRRLRRDLMIRTFTNMESLRTYLVRCVRAYNLDKE